MRTVCVKVFLHRGRIINEQCLAGAGIVNQRAGMHCVSLPEQKMKVWISVIHQIKPEACLQSTIAHLHPEEGVLCCLSVPSMEAGCIIYQRKDLALMENVYYLCITVIFPEQ